MTSPEARDEAIGPGQRSLMDYFDKTLDFLHRQGRSYGLIRYLDQVTGEEVYQIDAQQAER